MTRKARSQDDAPESPADEVQAPVEAQAQEATKSVDDLQREASLEAKLETLIAEQAAARIRQNESDAIIEEMRKALGRPANLEPSTIHIRATSVNQEVFAKNWAKREPGRKPEDAPKAGKTYTVTPVGASAKLGMPVATVTNAADPSDAKTHYALKLGRDGATITCNVQLADSAEA